MLTNNEMQALNAILDEALVKSKEEDDGDPLFHEVNVNDVKAFGDEQLLGDVYTILGNKGLIQCSGSVDERGNEVLEFVCITPEGLDALKSAAGVN